jgi:hypothetical protein
VLRFDAVRCSRFAAARDAAIGSHPSR